VRGYDEGAVGSGRSCVVASVETSVPLVSLNCFQDSYT
jgi:outer membrane protein assembly factor BamA